MMRPTKFRGKSSGIAIIAVLLSAVVFLGIIVAITGTLSISSRRSTGDQRVTLEAQYAAESGLSRVMAEAQNGLLQTWSALLLNMTSSTTMNAAEIKRLANLFCNYPGGQVLPLPSTTAPPAVFEYCRSQPGNNQPNRFDLFTASLDTTVVSGKTDYTRSVSPAIVGAAPTTPSEEAAFWTDVFSDGPNGKRYDGSFSNGVEYDVGFGFEVVGVDILAGSNYRFRFKVRDAVSKGRYTNASTVIATRTTQRSFPEEFFIDLAPPKLSYFLSLTDSQTPAPGAGGKSVFFTKDVLFDGPVHSNGALYFRGNPWFSNEVTSAGCNPQTFTLDANGRPISNPAYTTVTQGNGDIVSTCDTTPVKGYYNDGNANNAADTKEFTVTGNEANFPGYATGATLTASAPEFALQNSVAGDKPKPWNYNGNFSADIVTLPKLSTPQRKLAQESGILVETNANPAISGFYKDPTPSVYLQATSDVFSSSNQNTSFTKVPNNGTAAVGQVIQMTLNQKISRCNAPATGILITPPDELVTVGTSKTFSAKVVGQDTYSYEFAPTIKDVTWSATAPVSLTGDYTTPKVVTNPTGNATATYKPTAGYAILQNAPPSAPVQITATTPGGITASTTLRVNPNAPVVTLNASSDTLFFGGGTSTTLSWNFGSGAGPFGQLLEQSTNGPTGPWTTVSGAPTQSDGTANTNFVASPPVTTTYRLTAVGPTGLSGSDTKLITVAPPAQPSVPLTMSLNSSTPIPFGGQTRTFTWDVSNVNATSTASGAGPGPYTFVLEQSTTDNITGYTPLLTITNAPASGPLNTFLYDVPINKTASDVIRRFRVTATNTTTTLSNPSNRVNVTQLRPANPVVNANFVSNYGTSGNSLPFGGAPTTLQWTVTNNTATAAGAGPYTYKVESSTASSGGPWTTTIFSSTTATSTLVNPTAKIWYNVTATNSTTGLFNADYEEAYFKTIPLPVVDLSASSTNVPAANSKISLTYSVRNAVNSGLSGGLNQVIQSNATPDGLLTSATITNVNVPGPTYTDYTITASNTVGTVSKTVRVYINGSGPALPIPPVINTFFATPPTIYYPNNTSTLGWTLSGGTPSALSISPSVGSVLGRPNQSVTLNNTTTYTLTASNAGGSTTLNTTVTVVPAATPKVTLNAPNPNPVAFTGGTTNLTWNVTNTNATSTASGAGPGFYTYVIQEQVSGVWTTRDTQTNQPTNGSFSYTAPANSSTSDVQRPFRVLATNTTTNLQGPSGVQNVIVSAPANPVASIAASVSSLPFGGGQTTISWDVSNDTAAGAGVGPYTYTVERMLPGGNWTAILTNTSTISLPQTLSTSGDTKYRVTARNTTTGRTSNVPVTTVTVAQPAPPSIDSLTANDASPYTFPSSAGGSVTFKWTTSGGPITSLSMDQGVTVVNGTTSKPGVAVTSTKIFTLTASGPGGSATPVSVKVNVPTPPQTLSGITKTGIDVSRDEKIGSITPGWKAEPQWTGTGSPPTVTAGMYAITVDVAGEAVSGTSDANGNVTLSIGALPNNVIQKIYTVTSTLTVGGVPKSVSWKITIGKPFGSGSLRPRAKLTQTPPNCGVTGGPVSYDWATFVDYYIDKDNNMWSRTYPSLDQNANSRPPTTNQPWIAVANKFNGVVYIDGGAIVRGPARSNIALSDTAAPSVANFAALTLATDGKLTVIDDLKYENPVCSTSPTRAAETTLGSNNGLVTPATCKTTKSDWSRNVLGLYSSSTEGIELKTTQKKTVIQAISLASQGKIQVAGLRQTSTDSCPSDLTPGNDLGSISIQGGLIQKTYGEFSNFDASSANSTITCGYGRTMTYDIRMREVQYAPPGFPEAPNAKPTITIKTSSNPTQSLTIGQSLPMPRGFSRIK